MIEVKNLRRLLKQETMLYLPRNIPYFHPQFFFFNIISKFYLINFLWFYNKIRK